MIKYDTNKKLWNVNGVYKNTREEAIIAEREYFEKVEEFSSGDPEKKNGIKEAREAAGLSQQVMSKLLDIPKRTIEDWERGKSNPPKYTERLIIKELEEMMEKN